MTDFGERVGQPQMMQNGPRRLPREHDIEVYLDGEMLSVLSAGRLNAGSDAGLLVVCCTRKPLRRPTGAAWIGHVLASGGFCLIRCPHYPVLAPSQEDESGRDTDQ